MSIIKTKVYPELSLQNLYGNNKNILDYQKGRYRKLESRFEDIFKAIF